MSAENEPGKKPQRPWEKNPGRAQNLHLAVEELLGFSNTILAKAATEIGIKEDVLQRILTEARLMRASATPVSIYCPLISSSYDGPLILADTIADPKDYIAEAEKKIDREAATKQTARMQG